MIERRVGQTQEANAAQVRQVRQVRQGVRLQFYPVRLNLPSARSPLPYEERGPGVRKTPVFIQVLR